MQRHADAQAVDEHTGHQATVFRGAGFLFNDRGQDERVVRAAQRRVGRALGPGRLQLALHGEVGTLEHHQVARAFAEGVGVGVEAALGGHTGCADCRHEVGLTQRRGGLLQVRCLGQLGSKLPEGPALDQAHGRHDLVATHHLVEQGSRGDARADRIAARADLARPARPAKPLIQQERIGPHTGLHPGIGDFAR